ncbi:MAG: hypothetical protein P8130_09215, partial [Deltaproteobacteria bacterium]
MLGIVLWVLLGITMPAWSAEEAASNPASQEVQGEFFEVSPAPVVVWGRKITTLRGSYENYSPADRAAAAVKRILAIPVATEYKIEAIDGSEGKYTG